MWCTHTVAEYRGARAWIIPADNNLELAQDAARWRVVACSKKREQERRCAVGRASRAARQKESEDASSVVPGWLTRHMTSRNNHQDTGPVALANSVGGQMLLAWPEEVVLI